MLGVTNRNCCLFFEFDVIMTSLWRHFCHVDVIFFIILWHFTTKILKSLNTNRKEMANISFWHLLGEENPYFFLFFKFEDIFCHFNVILKWNTCYRNSKYLFLTFFVCEKSELLFVFRIWSHYDDIFVMLT